MWSGLYLSLFGLAVLATYLYTIKQESVFFWTAIATATWTYLALTGGSVIVVVDSGKTPVSVESAVFLMGGFALISAFAFMGTIFGYFPPSEEPGDSEMQLQQT